MPKLKAVVQHTRCDPKTCSPEDGICPAVKVCRREILEQEEPHESPVLLRSDMCRGCGDCVPACPLEAIKMG